MTQSLQFIPFELTPSQRLQNLRSEFESILGSKYLDSSKSIQNTQINGRLRIYPPGIGVVSLTITLNFSNYIHVEVVAQIARNIEEVLFVDPKGVKIPYNNLMLDIVNEVVKQLFKGFDSQDRRWIPPTTTYCFRDDCGLYPDD